MFATDLPDFQACDVRAVKESLRELVSDLEPDDVFVFDAPGLLAEFAEIEILAASAKTLLARRAEMACTWQGEGYRSAAEQLAVISGTSTASARRTLETSKQIAELPATAQALREGRLSPAKAEAIADAATVAPATEERLLALGARAPLGEVRDECLRAKAVDRDAAHARIHRERGAREYTDTEGAWSFHARGTPADGARFRAAHGPIVDEMFKAARAEGRRETYEAYAFDALIELAERASGAGEPTTDTTTTTKSKRTQPKFLALVRVDHAALQRGGVEDGETCEITGLGPIPVHVARELLGDAILKLVITKGVDVANVTHLGRSATMAQQVALWWRSPMCTTEGCTYTRRLENDHRYEWVKTRRTRVDELDPLCDHHHDLKTYDGWALVEGIGPRPMVPPDDPRHPKYRPPP